MPRVSWLRMLASIGGALVLVGLLYLWHPGWFENDSPYSLPPPDRQTATAGPVATPVRPKATPTPATPHVGMTQHLDNIWVTPRRVEHSQGGHGIVPNIGDEFLVVYMRIVNRSETNFRVALNDFQVLDSFGQLDPPMQIDFTRRRLREVSLVPGGHTEGTLVFEAPAHDSAAELVYQPDVLSPSKHKLWILK